MHSARPSTLAVVAGAIALAAASLAARADVVTDWNAKAGELLIEAKLGTPPANRAMAYVQTAVLDSVNAITRRYPQERALNAPKHASVDAAVAAANRTALARLIPAQQAAIDAAYQEALARIADGPAKSAGIEVGEKAAAAVFAARADDTLAIPDTYRPFTAPGAYVPTAAPAAYAWPQRKPWLLARPAQFRPGPPPALTSDTWARDFEEVKAYGARASTRRSAVETEIARFWDYSLPPIYFGVVRSVAAQPGRDVIQNARLYAAVAQVMDDGLIAVMDAKYHYNFWRPATAIRNGDLDGHDATERDPSWAPLIDAPMHPEYPSAHSILASAIATVLRADLGRGPVPTLSTTSATAKGVTRSWTSLDDFVREVANARVWEGIHYRTSTEVGIAMGRDVGRLAVARFYEAPL